MTIESYFLNDQLNVKIGNFGMATRIEFDGERKNIFYGSSNYIAPEILNETGHSFEVDIWSIGCIMFTLLVGQSPFETKTLEESHSNIRSCEYRLPDTLDKSAAQMIIDMLQLDPAKRPSVHKCAEYDFLTEHFIPNSLPLSCLVSEPRLGQFKDGDPEICIYFSLFVWKINKCLTVFRF